MSHTNFMTIVRVTNGKPLTFHKMSIEDFNYLKSTGWREIDYFIDGLKLKGLTR